MMRRLMNDVDVVTNGDGTVVTLVQQLATNGARA
jgi:hypothetical protein